MTATEPIIQTLRCVECGRRFDMLNPAEASEFVAGHDCEPVDQPTENERTRP